MKNNFYLILILILSIFLRIYQVSQHQPLLWDEAALGYNTYTILKTGRDEYGKLFPVIFKSFGDYKPGFYIYLDLFFVWLLKLNTLSTRAPSILAGVGICILLYKLVNNETRNQTKSISVFFMSAITPYLIHYSRGAWETNIASFLYLLTVYLIFKKKANLSLIPALLSIYTYQSAKLMGIILIIFALTIILKTSITKFTKSLIIIGLSLLPMILGLVNGSESNRLKVFNLASYPRSSTEENLLISQVGKFNFTIFYNDKIHLFNEFTQRYLNHFSPKFLFFEGDWQNPRHTSPYTGVLLFPCLILLPLGLLSTSKTKLDILMVIWLFSAPISSAITRDQIHATRSMSFAIPLVYFSGIGLAYVVDKSNKWLKYLLFMSLILSLVYYLDMYFNHSVQKNPKEWLWGYKEIMSIVDTKNKSKYNHIYITDFYLQPYIYYAFFNQTNPQTIQSNTQRVISTIDVGSVTSLENINFGPINFNTMSNFKNTLIIISEDEVLRQGINKSQLTEYRLANSSSATFYSYETK